MHCYKEKLEITEIEMNCQSVAGWVKSKTFFGALGNIVEDCVLLISVGSRVKPSKR